MDSAIPILSIHHPPAPMDDEIDNDDLDGTHYVDPVQALVYDDSEVSGDDDDGESDDSEDVPIVPPVLSIFTNGMRPITLVR